MTCRHCVRRVTAHVRDLPGTDSVEANGVSGDLIVRGRVTEKSLREALKEIGFPASDHQP